MGYQTLTSTLVFVEMDTVSFLLNFFLLRIGQIKNLAGSHMSEDIFHLILLGPSMDSVHRSLFVDSLSFYDI